jgi:hypothetical protein
MPGGKEREEPGGKDKQKDMEIVCKNIVTNLFQLVLCIKIDDVEKVLIHKGHNASIELLLENHSVELDFTGDMER